MKNIKIGDKVKVVRKPKYEEMGVYRWFANMEEMIGTVYEVEKVYSCSEFVILNNYGFPFCCCEKVISNEVIMSKYSYKGVTNFDKIIEDNKDELAFFIKGKENFVVGIDKRIQSIHIIYESRIFYESKGRFWLKANTNNTKFNFGVFSMTQFEGVKSEIFQAVKEFKSRTVKKVYTFK